MSRRYQVRSHAMLRLLRDRLERQLAAVHASLATLHDQIKRDEEADSTKVNEENRSTQLEAIFEENEAELNILQDTLTERLGALKELFGVMQQVAGDARTRFDNSLTNVQYPDRSPFLEDLAKKIGSNSKLPSIDEIERLWYELQREMTESGKVVKFTTDVIDTNGSKPVSYTQLTLPTTGSA